MAVTQATAGDKLAFGNVRTKDADGYYYTTLGSIRLYQGVGSTHTVITSTVPRGSIYVETTDGDIYICTVTTGTWVVVGSLS